MMRDHKKTAQSQPTTDRMRLLLILLDDVLLLVLLFLLSLRFYYRRCNSVEITLAVLGDFATTVLTLLEDTNLLE